MCHLGVPELLRGGLPQSQDTLWGSSQQTLLMDPSLSSLLLTYPGDCHCVRWQGQPMLYGVCVPALGFLSFFFCCPLFKFVCLFFSQLFWELNCNFQEPAFAMDRQAGFNSLSFRPRVS